MVMNLAPRYDMNFQRDYSNLMDFLLNRRSPLLPRVKETRGQVQVLVQEPDLGRRWNTWTNIPARLSLSPSYTKQNQCFLVWLPTSTKKSWQDIKDKIDYSKIQKFDLSSLPESLKPLARETLDFCLAEYHRGTFSRGDYKELCELAIICWRRNWKVPVPSSWGKPPRHMDG